MFADPMALSVKLRIPFDAAKYAAAHDAIEDATAEIRAYCRQHFSLVEDDVVELRGTDGRRLRLPQRPVQDVTEVLVNGEEFIEEEDFRRVRDTLFRFDGWGGDDGLVVVTYTHGYEEIPREIEKVCLSLAMRLFSNPEGIMQMRMGADYSVSYAADPEAVVGLNRSERRVLDGYHRYRSNR